MKFTFKAQKHQLDAVNSVISVFKGQEQFKKKKDYKNLNLFSYYSNNQLYLSDEQILNNIKKIQKENEIKLSEKLKKEGEQYHNLDISMETGTGKTYTYIRTIFELNKNYGWTKFIVVVPSSAIKLGVNQTFKDTERHFYDEYGKKIKSFIYDSKNLHYVRDFAIDSEINVMIITMQSFAESNRNRVIYEERDNLNSNSPIDVISNVNPIIIRDEPQRMEGKITTGALNKFNPLFFLNYSATHKNIHNLIYDLDSLDAYRNKLVKRIEVKGIELVSLSGANCYLYLDRIEVSKNKPPLAKVEFERKNKKNEIKRVFKKLKGGDDLYSESGNLESYKGIKICEIKARENSIFLSNDAEISVGQLTSYNNDDFQRIQIHETILSHFEKEKDLYKKGIKVLSLFFLDDVSNYRQYEENEVTLGKYGEIFENEYKKILDNCLKDDMDSEYEEYLKRTENDVSKVHNGYFSKDKTTKKDQDKENNKVYNQILNDKKSLLSLENPLRFIFTKFALREGWDCPNIFQICTLKHSSNDITRRQEIGRGLRLCVDQKGNRIDRNTSEFDINSLTVIANESYDSFVQGLQSEYDADCSDKNRDQNKKGTIHNARDKIKIKINKENKKKFEGLWELIKPKYIYKIKLDNRKLVKKVTEEIIKTKYIAQKTLYKLMKGCQSNESNNKINWQYCESYESSYNQNITKYDLIGKIGSASNLTRKTAYEILKNIGDNRIKEFAINPESFIKTLCEIINKNKIESTNENIFYKKTKHTYKFSIFETENIYKNDSIGESEKSLQNYIQLDSSIEKTFAEDLNNLKRVTVYAKLPKKFKIPTPIGNYTPDWAIVCEKHHETQIYFIIETKGTTNLNDLRQHESRKIEYAKKLFDFIKNKNKEIRYDICDNAETFIEILGNTYLKQYRLTK